MMASPALSGVAGLGTTGLKKLRGDAKQREHYSGKKKRHLLKNTVMSLPDKLIVFLGRTFSGHEWRKTMMSRMIFWAAQASTTRCFRLGPMPSSSVRRSGVCSMTSKTRSPKARTNFLAK
jgi:hypothetical protein